ncbi:flagellar basal body-associated FliL family protein [Desulfotruncus alcoholivorax]|uniref:flagellar basal body-associated FliL family protein n=1 Tax=Desulfotruncus alcoholivorax TaxID=265477 RepID=UPI000408580F|nr:flagellar basal body-associated FliL family protein [Desulfotruncus alcoholivorax]
MAFRKPKKDKDKQKKADQAEKKTGAGGGNLLIMFVMMLVVFMVGAGMVIGYYNFFGPAAQANNKQPKKEKVTVLANFDLGDMVVNLADQDQSRFLKTKITLGYIQTKENDQLMDEKKSQVIEEVLLTLRKKTFADVSPPGATDKLKTELIKAINSRLNASVVKELYFTEYIVQ